MPARTCLGCRKVDEQIRLVRLAVDAAGRVTIDRKRRLAGRGAYVHAQRSCVTRVVGEAGRERLEKSFRRKVQSFAELEGFGEEGT